ncbi:hypothetical protein HDE_03666 [Halotydeus destructor]|nr:hypothetical protein HDE_03666 [Halotydeus destructor]
MAGAPVGTSVGDVVDFTDVYFEGKGYLVQDVSLSGNETETYSDFLAQIGSVYTLPVTIAIISSVFLAAALVRFVSVSSRKKLNKWTLFDLYRMFLNQHDVTLQNFKQNCIYISTVFFLMIIIWVNVNSIGAERVVAGKMVISSLAELLEQETANVQWSTEGYTDAKFRDPRHKKLHAVFKKFHLAKKGIGLSDIFRYGELNDAFIIEEEAVMAYFRKLACSSTYNGKTGRAGKQLQHYIPEADERYATAFRKNVTAETRLLIGRATRRIAEAGFADKMAELGVQRNELFKPEWAYCMMNDFIDDFDHRAITLLDFPILLMVVPSVYLVAFFLLCASKVKFRSKKNRRRRRIDRASCLSRGYTAASDSTCIFI